MSGLRELARPALSALWCATLLVAPWPLLLALMLHGAFGLLPPRAWWDAAALELGLLVLVGFVLQLALVSRRAQLLGWFEGRTPSALLAVPLVGVQLVGLLLVSAEVPGASLGVLLVWVGLVVLGAVSLDGVLWLPSVAQRGVWVATSVVLGIAAALLVALLLIVALSVLPFLLMLVAPLRGVLMAGFEALGAWVGVVPHVVGGLVGGFMLVRVARNVLIGTEDGLFEGNGLLLLAVTGVALALGGMSLLPENALAELSAEPGIAWILATLIVSAAASFVFTLARQAFLRASAR